MKTSELPVGWHSFSRRQFINYQLNRWWSLGYTAFEEIQEAGRRITSFDRNEAVFRELAGRALQEGRPRNAAFYLRAAEFLAAPGPAKRDLHAAFHRQFHEAFATDAIEVHEVPYGESHLAANRLPSRRDDSRGTVVIHGGFDSFIEEFYCFWEAFSNAGYDVIAFDGPGQGASLHRFGVASDHDWEKPVGAILDHFRVDDATLLGISFGGYWCVRAAAYEKRVRRLIVHAPFYDLLAPHGALVRGMVGWLTRHPRFLNWSVRTRAKMIPTIDHMVKQTLLVNRAPGADPAFAVDWILGMNAEHIGSHLVDQDTLLLGGEKDRFQSPRLLELQKEALTNARSVQSRIFTREEQAANHCQMGNLGLALDTMVLWLTELEGNAKSG